MANQAITIIIRDLQTIRHQKANIFCSIIPPIVCLLFLLIIKQIVKDAIAKTYVSVKLDVPIIFNTPIYLKLKYLNFSVKTSICEEWYLYESENKNDTKTLKFFEEMINSNIIKSFCEDNPKNFTLSPYFLKPKDVQILENETDINSYLYDRQLELNSIDVDTILKETILSPIPDGAITLKKMDEKNFYYKMQVNDARLVFYHRRNAVTSLYIYNWKKGGEKYEIFCRSSLGMLWGMGLFNRAYINKLFPNINIISCLQIMPIIFDDNEQNVQRFLNFVGTMVYPFSVSLLMPLFIYNIVLEKERQLIEIMRINGLKMRNYWIGTFIYNYIIYIITMVLFILNGKYIFCISLFKETSFLLLFLTIFIWGFGQIGLAFFYQSFLSDSRTASIIGYLLTSCIIATFSVFNIAFFALPREAPYIFNFFPTYAICRIFYYFSFNCGCNSCIEKFEGINSELRHALLYMMIGSIFFIILGIYLNEVLPKKYGILKNPLFCITDEIKYCQHNNITLGKDNIEEKEESSYNNILNDNNNPLKDKEIEKELIFVENIIKKGENELKKYPLVCSKLTKIYSSNAKSKNPEKKNKKSLNNFTLCLKENEIFGLLGPNGAGKTTFFSILTGIYELTSGNAFIRGHSIKRELERCHELIGYCPQFDFLWEDLSVENTLLFYSKIKNRENSIINSRVEKVLQDIKLTKYRKHLVRELSGGMKRRLSLGIALISEPPIIFLDEPTTGLDPKNKRKIWDILLHCKGNRCMILTTHLMDEAEMLCDRIGIIAEGKLKCLGALYKLKAEYGKGLKLCINLKPYIYENNINKYNDILKEKRDRKIGFIFDKSAIIEQIQKDELRIEKLKQFLDEIYHKNCKLIEKHRSAAIFKIESKVFNPEILFTKLEESKTELEISNWSITQVNLEDIFITLTKNVL